MHHPVRAGQHGDVAACNMCAVCIPCITRIPMGQLRQLLLQPFLRGACPSGNRPPSSVRPQGSSMLLLVLFALPHSRPVLQPFQLAAHSVLLLLRAGRLLVAAPKATSPSRGRVRAAAAVQQHVVGAPYGLKFPPVRLSSHVGVVSQRQAPERQLDLRLVCTWSQAQHAVWVAPECASLWNQCRQGGRTQRGGRSGETHQESACSPLPPPHRASQRPTPRAQCPRRRRERARSAGCVWMRPHGQHRGVPTPTRSATHTQRWVSLPREQGTSLQGTVASEVQASCPAEPLRRGVSWAADLESLLYFDAAFLRIHITCHRAQSRPRPPCLSRCTWR